MRRFAQRRARLAMAVALAQLVIGPSFAVADPTTDPSPPTTPAPAPTPVQAPAPTSRATQDDPLAEAFRVRGAPSREHFLSAARRLTRIPELSLNACRSAGRGRVVCMDTECPGACQVVRVTLHFAIARGRVRLISRQARHVGDTGACGCCMLVD